MLRLCLLLALTLPIPAWASDLTGSARVVDRDTLELATPGGEAIIRLHGIDAPELAAPTRPARPGAAGTRPRPR